jgi:hypothetical protein
MQTEPVTEEQVALEEFKRADKDYQDAAHALRRYAFEHRAKTFTVEYGALERKTAELALLRNAKLVAWGDLKKSSTSTVRAAVQVEKICSQCGAIGLLVPISGSTRCNQCGFQT